MYLCCLACGRGRLIMKHSERNRTNHGKSCQVGTLWRGAHLLFWLVCLCAKGEAHRERASLATCNVVEIDAAFSYNERC